MRTTGPPPTPALQAFENALAGRVAGTYRNDAASRALYATDASMYEVVPLGVFFPSNADDVAGAVQTAAEFGIPLLPRGGGSSLAGQTVNEAVVLDFSLHLRRILDTDLAQGRVRVEPGITLDALNRHLSRSGWMVGPDPASGSRATLGGMMANNATGTHSILYGNTIRHVRDAGVVLSDGTATRFAQRSWDSLKALRTGREGSLFAALVSLASQYAAAIREDMPPHWRRANGYRLEELLADEPNLAKLLCGSEGTLGMVTDLTLDLVRRPAHTSVGVVHFASRREALTAVTRILETDPSAVELFDGAAIRQCRGVPEFARRMTFVDGDPAAVLITEYYGQSEGETRAALDRLQAHMPAKQIVRLENVDAVENVWAVRREALGLIMNVRGDHKPIAFIEDASVPVEHLADYIEQLDRLLDDLGIRAVMYAHASAGCLHVRPFINTKDASDVSRMKELASGSADLVRRYGGWVSSEHGDGIARSWLNEAVLGPRVYQACRDLKSAFDPAGILNPGRVVDAPPMTAHLRTGPDYEALPVSTRMDFSVEGGFARAVEQCNGNGACRKIGTGAMCPSFMATREEADSTRGRANALRLSMTGRIPELDDAAVYDVLDLCLQCKACKSECPSSVDMAKIKTEWLSGYWERNPAPLKTRFFAELPTAARVLSGPLARAANAVAVSRLGGSALRRFLGIGVSRALPSFSSRPYARTGGTPAEIRDNSVVLFADTFSNFQHPEVARAAERVLTAAGFHVIPVGDVCCGRTYLSKGFVTKAQRTALRAVSRLHPFATLGIPIIGLEPSCILTFADEYLSLLPGDPRTQQVADVAVGFERFVSRHSERFERLDWRVEATTVHVHPHCHQKALGDANSVTTCLEVAGCDRVNLIDAGCCGMAGAFGYEHADVSRRIAEDRLLPALAASPESDRVVAPGSSCRAQIADLAGRKAEHPAELLSRLLA